jgi:hypothetical protein
VFASLPELSQPSRRSSGCDARPSSQPLCVDVGRRLRVDGETSDDFVVEPGLARAEPQLVRPILQQLVVVALANSAIEGMMGRFPGTIRGAVSRAFVT